MMPTSEHCAWEIDPAGAVGPLRLGMEEHEYKSVLASEPRMFRRTKDSTEVTLAFNQELVHLTIDANNRVNGISLFRPREALLHGVQVLGRPLEEVDADLIRRGFPLRRVDTGLSDENDRISLIEVDGIIDGVEVAKR